MRQFHSDSTEYYLLKQWKYLLFERKSDFHNRPQYNRKLKRYINKAQLLEKILEIDLLLEKAYHLVDIYFNFNNTFLPFEEKMDDLMSIISEYQQSNIPELKQFSRTLYNWRVEICHSFILIDYRRISNAFTEASNGTIKDIMRNAKGMHSFTRARNRMMYVVNQDTWTLR
ncbi:transposase [Tuanshanicoccus lijuaniae]|uniref:transposase n=2 Tax=Aerococcaceae bacterium zg-1292 TaxID=2774330 RepID=UPI001BD8B999|nr:transposase [Aerococcaceae bacterium zg-A91]MBS4458535.1 transposase [Aerococcaceae bacterium zg-BR33]